MKHLTLMIFILIIYLLMGCTSGIDFIRQVNSAYTTNTKGGYICDTEIKILQDWVIRPEPKLANLYIVYRYPSADTQRWSLIGGDDGLDRALIVAFDINKDGLYEYLMFDIDGNGSLDWEFSDVWLTEQQVLDLYCKWQVIEK